MADTLEPLKGLLNRVRGAISRHKSSEISGLRIVHDPDDADIDIVAVHGLGGQGFRSWITWDTKAGKGKSWLEELLGADVPNARIMTYGYMSDGVSYRYIVRNVVYGRALDLAKVLAAQRQRDGTTRRPLFFIAHSLGGWIVKRALIISSEAAGSDLKDVELSTCGVAFFGTLSPGLSSSPSPLAHVIRRTTTGPMGEGSHASKPFTTIEWRDDDHPPHARDMEWLEQQMEAFKAITANLPRLSFYETKMTQGGFVVDQRHSIAGSDGAQIGLKATHSDLIRFHGRDANYKTFIHHFRDMLDTNKVLGLLESKRKTFDLAAVHHLGYLDAGYAVPYKLPVESNPTVSRQALLETLESILNPNADPLFVNLSIACLWGAAGNGKSTLACHFAKNNQDSLSFVFWIRGESWETVVASYLEFANTIVEYYAKDIPRDQVENDLGFAGVGEMLKAKNIMHLDTSRLRSVVYAVKDWLLRPENSQWLLVFDNVESSYDIYDFIPLTLSGKIIVTSRDSNCCSWGTKCTVGEMTEDEAVKLISTIVGDGEHMDGIEGEAAARLVRQLFYHPQSIAVAASTIRNKGLSVADYQARMDAKLPFKLVGSTIHQSPVTRTILQISAMLSASVIPVALFSTTASFLQVPDRFKSLLGEIKAFQDSDHLDEVLQYLLDQNFIQTPTSPSDTSSSPFFPSSPSSLPSSQSSITIDTFVVDPAARDHVRGTLTKDEKVDHAWMACNVCVDGIRKNEAASRSVFEVHEFGRIMAPHAKTCYDDWSPVLSNTVDDEDIAWHILGQVCMTQGAVDQAIGCFELALQQDSLKMDVKEKIQASLSLASLLQQSGQHRKSCEVLSDIDIDSIDQALGYRVSLARASATAAQGELVEAEDQYETLELEQETALGPTDMATVGTVQKLASTLEQLGKSEEAQALYRRVYISYQNMYGPNDRMTLDALDDLANVCKQSHAMDEAEALYKRSVDIRTRALGANHPQTAYAVQNLAVIDDLQGRYVDAKAKYQKVLDTLAPTLGKAHPLYTTTMENLALSSRWLGGSLVDSDASHRKGTMSTPSTTTTTSLPNRTATAQASGSSSRPSIVFRSSSSAAQKRAKSTAAAERVSRAANRRRAFEDAERLYLDVLQIKRSARELYSEEQIVSTGSKLAEMYENEAFFVDTRAEKLNSLKGTLREGRRRGTI